MAVGDQVELGPGASPFNISSYKTCEWSGHRMKAVYFSVDISPLLAKFDKEIMDFIVALAHIIHTQLYLHCSTDGNNFITRNYAVVCNVWSLCYN